MKKKFGLVLASGGAKGYIHIGVLKRLEEENIKPDYISGSSIGALIGAMYALGYTVKEIEKFAEKYDKKYLLEYRLPSISLIKPNKIYALLKEVFQNKTFEDTKIKLFIAQTNLTQEKVEYISTGPIYDAVIASISIPGIFPPIKKEGDLIVDGGVLDPIPLDAFNKKSNITLAIKFYYDYKSPIQKTPEIINILLKTITASQNYITEEKLKKNKPNLLLDIKESKEISALNFNNPDPLIKLGYEKMDTEINQLKKLLKIK